MNRPARIGPPMYCVKCEERTSWLRILRALVYMRCENPRCGHAYEVDPPQELVA